MSDLATRDYTRDMDVLRDPYPFFEAIRTPDGVFHDTIRDIYFVTGHEETVALLLDNENNSSGIAVAGPIEVPPFHGSKEEIRQQVDTFRAGNLLASLLVNYDGKMHADVRGLIARLFTPSRLRSNEEYMQDLADQMVGEVVAAGKAEVVRSLSAAYVTLVIADLLGVPADDREKFREVIDNGPPAGNMQDGGDVPPEATLMYLGTFFMRYITERRGNDTGDVMSELANATFADGTQPDLMEVVKASMFLFAAGQDTSAKLVANSLRYLCENSAMQDRLRANPADVAPFIEEMLRLEGSSKITTRLPLQDVTFGSTTIPAGKPIVVALAAANRDPKKWDDPAEFRVGRPGIKQHLAFGRGAHTCIGAALARAEVDILLKALLRDTRSITIDEDIHGPPGARDLVYEPSYIIRGLDKLHVRLEGK